MAIKILIFLILSIVINQPAYAVLPPEEQQKLEKAYLEEVDIKAEISLFKTKKEFFWWLKSAFKGGCECEAVYTIEKIIEKPRNSNLKENDLLVLVYPCGKDKGISWVGSFLPWAKRGQDGKIIMSLPLSYLKPLKSGAWQIENNNKVFAPVSLTEN